jgi:hypothetical protein
MFASHASVTDHSTAGLNQARPRPYFSWASCAAPLVGALAGLIPFPPDLIARVLIGIAVASVPGMICALVAIKRRERPWWVWVLALLINAYPFMWFLFGLSLQLGITRIHL